MRGSRHLTTPILLLWAGIFPVAMAAEIVSSTVTIPGYERGQLLATEDFSSDLKGWLREGDIRARIQEGKLLVESFHPGKENPKGNIWWRKEFREPYLIEFDYRSLTDNGLTMVFWNAFGIDGGNIFSWQRSGRYTEYISGNLSAYHLSFHRFGSGLSNIRKAPGFHLLSSVPDPVTPDDQQVHRIAIAATGNRQRVFVDGELIHDISDDGKPCMNRNRWQHELPCKGTGPAPMHGAFGIRVTQRQKALFDRLRVYKLSLKPAKENQTCVIAPRSRLEAIPIQYPPSVTIGDPSLDANSLCFHGDAADQTTFRSPN
ncbi:MAG TPA: DUF1961 family protein [Gammaproteobacteria bacterium]|nr:DUF1961 family protein [Gammaproteobacteria bacterium]